jgi:hypothetical protein
LVQWRRRKKGSPRQIGQAFPIDESQQKKKGALSKLRERFAGKTHGRQEHEYMEKLKDLIRERTETGEQRLMDGVLTEGDAEYLQKKGLIEIDPYTDNISLTEAGQVYFLGEKMKEKKKVLKSLTEMEKDMILEKRELEGEENKHK